MALTEAASPSGASCSSPNNMDWILHIVPTYELKADVSKLVCFLGDQKLIIEFLLEPSVERPSVEGIPLIFVDIYFHPFDLMFQRQMLWSDAVDVDHIIVSGRGGDNMTCIFFTIATCHSDTLQNLHLKYYSNPLPDEDGFEASLRMVAFALQRLGRAESRNRGSHRLPPHLLQTLSWGVVDFTITMPPFNLWKGDVGIPMDGRKLSSIL